MDQLKVIVPCGHPLANSDPFPVEALATEPVIQLEEGDDYEIRAAFDEMGVRPHVRYIAREDRTILSMVSNGLGISLLPELMVRHSPYPWWYASRPRPFTGASPSASRTRRPCPTPPSGLWTTSGPGCR